MILLSFWPKPPSSIRPMYKRLFCLIGLRAAKRVRELVVLACETGISVGGRGRVGKVHKRMHSFFLRSLSLPFKCLPHRLFWSRLDLIIIIIIILPMVSSCGLSTCLSIRQCCRYGNLSLFQVKKGSLGVKCVVRHNTRLPPPPPPRLKSRFLDLQSYF